MAETIMVELVLAHTAEVQKIAVPIGTTIGDLLAQHNVVDVAACGIFAEQKPKDYQLQDLDRLEVYRSLSQDAKARRLSKTK